MTRVMSETLRREHDTRMRDEHTSNEAEACASLRAKGYIESFVFEAPVIRCLETGEEFQASQIVVAGVFRFEGASDPSDMSVVYALEAHTISGKRRLGILVDAFGTYATPGLGPFLEQVSEDRTKVQKLDKALAHSSGGV